MEDIISLDEASKLCGVPANTLRTRLNRGELSGVKIAKGQRMVWALHRQTVLDMAMNGSAHHDNYSRMLKAWEEEQRTGFNRREPLQENTIERNGFGVKSFWFHLKQEERLDRVTVDNVAQAIANVPADMIGTRENIYKSMMSFYKSLIDKDLRPETDIFRFKKFKPAPNKRPRRTFIRGEEEFKEILIVNQAWQKARTKYDRMLTDLLIKMLYYTGLRNTELCTLTLKAVDLRHLVIDAEGKNGELRQVGICPELVDPIELYLTKRTPTKNKEFLIQQNGRPLNRWIVANRVREVAAKAGFDLTPHGVRRTFITGHLAQGSPTALVQRIVGHKKLSTTDLYNMNDSTHALDLLRKPMAPRPKTSFDDDEDDDDFL